MASIPILDFYRQSSRADLRSDLVAGLTVGVMLVPQGMAYGMLAGLSPVVGLYASTLPLIVYGVLGTSRVLAVGPVAVVSMLTLSAIAPHAAAGSDVALGMAVTLAALVGVIQLAMAALRASFFVNFLSHPVLSGFGTASALLIMVSQVGPLLGFRSPRGHTLIELAPGVVSGLTGALPVTAAVGLGSMLFLIGFKRLSKTLPAALFVVILSVAANLLLDLEGAYGLAVVGEVPGGLPMPVLPGLSDVVTLLPSALAIALVGYVESISVAQSFARRAGQKVDAGQELLALGAANLASAFVQGMPVTGGFSRTAVAAEVGVRSPIASVVAALTVIVVLLFLTPFFTHLPLAALAATIIVAVWSLVDIKEIRHILAVKRRDVLPLLATLAVTLLLGVEPGIGAGVALSLGLFLWRSARPHVATLGQMPGTTEYRNVVRHPEAVPPPGVAILRVDASLYFANAAFLRDELEHIAHDGSARVMVLDLSAVNDVDVSAVSALEEGAAALAARGVSLRLARVKGPVGDVLGRAGFLAKVPAFETVHEAATAA